MFMKKFKRLFSIMLAISLIGTLLSGCAKKNDGAKNEITPTTPATDVSGTPQDSANWQGETSHIIVTFLTAGTEPKDIKEVEAAVNEMTVPKIGVEIEFKTLSVFEALSQYSMWIASGEPMDVAIVAFTDIASYVNQGMLLPLEELIPKNAPYIEQLGNEVPLYDAAVVKGSTYGIRVIPPSFGSGGGYLIKKEDLDAAGLKYENNAKVTLDELTNIFAKIKEVKPDTYPAGVFGILPSFKYTAIADALGTTASSGVLMGTDSTKVVDMYESEDYYNYLKYMRDWYVNGYIPKDAATAEVTLSELLKSGVISGNFNNGAPNAKGQAEKSMSKELVQLQIVDPYLMSSSSAENSYFALPATCKDPEASMRFVNMLYENADLANLIQWGIKDKHYKMVDEAKKIIAFPEGIDHTNTPYYNPLGFWGDQRHFYAMDESSTPDNFKVFNEKALANQTKAVGFCYDPAAMTSKIIAIDAVVSEYKAALETGSAELDSTYEEFIAKLKANGIDDVIADKQAQFDAWLAQQ